MRIIASVEGYDVEVHDGIESVSEHDWRAAVGEGSPYLDHRHLRALERSGLVGSEVGAAPRYLVLRDAEGAIRAAAPAFLKTRSHGEMGVDLGLPMAHERMVGPYYPKLQVEVPMTTTPGARLLVAAAEDPTAARRSLLTALDLLADHEGAASVQITYMTPEDHAASVAHDYLALETATFVWRSRGERDLDDLRRNLSRTGRRRILEEYDRPRASGLRFRTLPARDMDRAFISRIFDLYLATFRSHRTEPWLNLRYFEEVLSTMPDEVEVQMALEGDDLLGAFLCFTGSDETTIQHWLVDAPRRDVYFPLMFHVIEDAMLRGIRCLDFGPLGEHKSLRGAAPERVYHAVAFRNPEFRTVVARAFDKRNAACARAMEEMAKRLPYRDKKATS